MNLLFSFHLLNKFTFLVIETPSLNINIAKLIFYETRVILTFKSIHVKMNVKFKK